MRSQGHKTTASRILPKLLLAVALLLVSCGDDDSTPTCPTCDEVPPATVEDLAATTSTVTSVTLRWTAPGDDGDEGHAASYDLRYSMEPISIESWDAARQVSGEPAPTGSGGVQELRIRGLKFQSRFHFALRTEDDAHNWSEISNVAQATTLAPTFMHLTFGPESELLPRWSPDAQRIAYLTEPPSYSIRHLLYIVPSTGGAPTPVSPDSIFEFGGWSADASRVAFSSDHAGHINIWTAAAGGGNLLQITTGSAGDLRPSWSPDGEVIAFESSGSGPETRSIWTVPAIGGEATRLTGDWPNGALSLLWSPDATTLAFDALSGGIYTVNRAGGSVRPLTSSMGYNYFFCWSPDGRAIAFTSDRGGNMDIWMVSVVDGAETRVTSDSGGEYAPSWSADGAWIAYDGRGGNIWIISASGGEPIQLTHSNGWNAAWSPNDLRLAYQCETDGNCDLWVTDLE